MRVDSSSNTWKRLESGFRDTLIWYEEVKLPWKTMDCFCNNGKSLLQLSYQGCIVLDNDAKDPFQTTGHIASLNDTFIIRVVALLNVDAHAPLSKPEQDLFIVLHM
jgi:hypothetical protein